MRATAHMSNPVHRLVGPQRAEVHRLVGPQRADGPGSPMADTRGGARVWPVLAPSGQSGVEGLSLVDPTCGSKDGPCLLSLAPRSGSFRPGDVVGLMDISKFNGEHLLDRIEFRLREEHPGIDVKRYAKPTFSKPCPPEIRAQILSECNAVVCALAD